MSSLSIVTRPAAALSTADAKAHARIDSTFEDALLAEYVLAAQREAELFTGRAVGATVYRLALDRFPDQGEPILLPRPTIASIDSIAYDDADGNPQSLNVATDIQVDAWGEPARIFTAVSTNWPTTQTDKINAVRIQYTAGDDANIDPEVLQAIRLAVATWYEHREHVVEGSVSTIPNGFFRLLRLNMFRDRDLERFLAAH